MDLTLTLGGDRTELTEAHPLGVRTADRARVNLGVVAVGQVQTSIQLDFKQRTKSITGWF